MFSQFLIQVWYKYLWLCILFVYCSNENLVKDTYLRSNMDEQGWVPISLIAGFNRVSL